MAPKVVVPADFGRHHIGAPSHGNLTFNLKEGLPIKANSIIMSLNSPVIDHLTTDLHLTSLDADDFSRNAVDCFIEASYTGEMEAVNLDNFRDVNKMSYVFKVSWLTARCEGYFVSYLDKLDSQSSYTDLLFAVEEAVYLLSSLKKRDFLDLVVKKMSSIAVTLRDTFINQYLSDLVTSTKHQIDVCIAIVRSDVHVLAGILISHLEKHNNKSLDENSRYLLEYIDLGVCFKKSPAIHSKLFSALENLENVTKEDYRLLLSLHKLKTSDSQKVAEHVKLVEFPSFKRYLNRNKTFDDVYDMFSNDDSVKSLYMLFDGIVSMLDSKIFIFNDTGSGLLEKIIAIKEERGWSKLNFGYVNGIVTDTDTGTFVNLIKGCDKLVFKSNEPTFPVICEYSQADFIQEIFRKDKVIKFQFENSKYSGHEFTLMITSMKGDNPDTFDVKWCWSAPVGVTCEVPKLHIELQISRGGKWYITPLTWLGKPYCDKTKTYWNWGNVRFHDEGDNTSEMCHGKEGALTWNRGRTVRSHMRCRLIVVCE